MTKLSDIEYPLRLCVEMIYYCGIPNPKTQEMTSSEIKEKLEVFFDSEMINEAVKMLTGEQ